MASASAGRQYAAALIGLAAGAAVALWAVGQPWLTASAGGGDVPQVTAAVAGRSLVPAAGGIALLLLAGIAGVAATRGVARRLLGAGLALAAAGAVALCAQAGVGLADRGTARAEQALGLAPASVQGSNWWLVAVGGLLVAGLAAVAVALWGDRWPAMGGRYERSTPAAAAGGAAATVPSEGADLTSAQLWDALDRGEDPTRAPEVPQ